MNNLSLVLFLLLLLSNGIFAQNSERRDAIKENGWNMNPVKNLFEDNSQISRAKIKLKSKMGEIEVDLEHIAVKNKISFELEDFFTDAIILEWNNTTKPVVYVVQKYSFNNKLFAYLIKFKYQIISGNSIQYAGCMNEASYIDENGDGKFETRADNLESLPDWVK